MSVHIDPETRFIDSDQDVTYSREAVFKMRLSCPDCGTTVIPRPMDVGNLGDAQERYRPGPRWTCSNGHGSPDSL